MVLTCGDNSRISAAACAASQTATVVGTAVGPNSLVASAANSALSFSNRQRRRGEARSL